MTSLACPNCASNHLFRDGWYTRKSGERVQKWRCRVCGHKFIEKKLRTLLQENLQRRINSPEDIVNINQLCALEAKKLEPQTETKTVAGEILQQETKGKIVDFSIWMLKEGYSKATIKTRTKILKRLITLGADIFNPESVKETIAKHTWGSARKCIAADAYTSFLQMQNLKWEPPTFNRIRKLPFIPTENEIDQLIGGCNKRMATFLQLLKETGVRCGEASQLLWTDLDFVDCSIIVTPEKGSNTRKLKISNKLAAMLNELPKDSKTVFNANSDAMRKSYTKQRRLIAYKLKNQRLRQIMFHTFRHWKATMEYHKTRDILHVMQVLGHKSIRNTMMYTQLVDFQEDDYVARIAHTEAETCQLIEAGFEFVCDFGANKVFRKRK